MAIEDLDLEFEDEEEAKTASDAVNLDIDLSFSATQVNADIQKELQNAQATKTDVGQSAGQTNSNVIQHPSSNQVSSQQTSSHQNSSHQTSSHQTGIFRQQTNSHLKIQAKKMESMMLMMRRLEARMKKVEEQGKTNLPYKKQSVDTVKMAKLLDQHVTKILIQINSKSPQLKPEVQQIKKLLNAYLKKVS